uniref:Uncharacterized protein n=1 Tax=Siphoviridae sp. ctUse40 TaxID=2826356 RepID=A0A8S5NEQ2_9CAUD|nr:MAG TPA: hypothetical protein [Siphoviridae sp. ctUse40]
MEYPRSQFKIINNEHISIPYLSRTYRNVSLALLEL